ncbi:MAG: MFS transporter, partial [Bacteroidales bacterium]|nr:MFS transporter [Bacteroidales bacterium]
DERTANKTPGLLQIFENLVKMPKTMGQLAVVQFFSWFALFAMWVFTTPAVTQHIYGTTDTGSELYNRGANWVGICFGAYNGVAALYAWILPKIARMTSRKFTHFISLVAGGIGLLSVYFVKDPNLLLLSMVGVGLAWASILSMPYAILAGSLPAGKMGVYMGIFNFFIVIPQIVNGIIGGPLISSLFNNEAIYALIIAGVSMIISGCLVWLVRDIDDQKL